MTFTAEELGLIGSRHFTDHPPVPLDQIVAMVNLDMVGRLRDGKVSVGGYKSSDAIPKLVKDADAKSPLTLQDMGTDFDSRSDHANFMSKGIPAIFFFTGLHEQYHAPTDDPPLINYEGMEQIAEMTYGVIQAIDEMPREELKFNAPEGQEMLQGQGQRQGRGEQQPAPNGQAQPAAEVQAQPAANEASQQRRVRFGVLPEMGEVDPNAEGLVVATVMENSPAAKAGIQVGDVILKIGETPVKTLEDLQEVLVDGEPGKTVKVILKRDGEQQEIDVTFEANTPRTGGQGGSGQG